MFVLLEWPSRRKMKSVSIVNIEAGKQPKFTVTPFCRLLRLYCLIIMKWILLFNLKLRGDICTTFLGLPYSIIQQDGYHIWRSWCFGAYENFSGC